MFSILMFIIAFFVYKMTTTRELESKEVFFFLPGKYCLYVHHSSKTILQDFNHGVSCHPFIDNSSYAYAKGEFIPIKEYNITDIGYYSALGIKFEPKTYFVRGIHWDEVASFTMFSIGVIWITILSGAIRKIL